MYQHNIMFYRSNKDQFKNLKPIIQKYIDRKFKCIYLYDDNSLKSVKKALGKKIEYIEARKFYMPEGKFDPVLIRKKYEDILKDTIASGHEGLFATAEMTWAIGCSNATKCLCEYEKNVNQIFTNQLAAICQYNANKFDSEVLSCVYWAHPLHIADNETMIQAVQKNIKSIYNGLEKLRA